MAQYINSAPLALSLSGTPLSAWTSLSSVTQLSAVYSTVNLLLNRKLIADKATYTATETSTNLSTSKKLLADWSAYTYSPTNTNLSTSKKLIADTTSFTLTLRDALARRTMSAQAASYSATVRQAFFQRTASAQTASFSVSQVDNILKVGKVFSTIPRSFAATAIDTNLARGLKLAADQNFISVTGQGLGLARKINCASSAFSLTTSEAFLRKSTPDLVASTSSYTATLGDAALSCGILLSSDVSSVALTTFEAATTVTRTVGIDAASISVGTPNTNLVSAKKLVVDVVSLAISTSETDLAKGYAISPQTSAVVLSTQQTGLVAARSLVAETRGVSVGYNDTPLIKGYPILCQVRNLSVTTGDTKLKVDRTINADTIQVNLSLKDASLARHRKLTTSTRQVNATSIDTKLRRSGLGVSAEKRNFNLTGQPITFKRSVYLIKAEKAELEIDLNRFVISGDFTRTFLWDINYGSSVKTSRRINSYGKDNYSLRAQDGINRKKRVWNVRCSQSPETVKEIAHFFRENKGIKSFYWTPPNGSPGRWECTSHNITYDDFGTNTISAEFTEVFL